MLLIERLDLEFDRGLNVLTGETGAGKSILLDCLGFVLGWRGQADLVRKDATQGEVTAYFQLAADHRAQDVLQQAGFERCDELVLRRINSRDGRKTAFINDLRCSGDLLRRISETLIELHGQHDDRGLLNAAGHRDLLDEYAGIGAQLKECDAAWTALSQAKIALAAHIERLEKLKSEEDFLRHALAELETLNMQGGEEAALDARRRTMRAASSVRDDIANAAQRIGSEGAEGQIFSALRALEKAAPQLDDQLDVAIAALSRGATEIGEALQAVEGFLHNLDFNPSELEQTEDRLYEIRALARKHNVAPDTLPELQAQYAQRLELLDQDTKQGAALDAKVHQAHEAYINAAKALSQSRKKAAAQLDAAMVNELSPLKMERAVFTTQISNAAEGAKGFDAVAFTVATNPGAPAGPMNKIASGGELSRFLLALKVCLRANQTGVTLIFDEIDRGVGGATADAVGRRLSALGQNGQVLAVTHSPQVAALGNAHWRVEKMQQADTTFSNVSQLDQMGRVDEIARMLSAGVITAEARAAAQALLTHK